MTTLQLRAKLNALKRKYTLPLLILRLRRGAQILCHDWAAAEANNQPIPSTPMMVAKFAQNGPRLPNYLDLHRYIVRTRRAQTSPNPYDIVRALLPHTHESGILPRIMNLYSPPANPNPTPQCYEMLRK